jgi:predicted alpha-1,2-mannosidase
MRQLFPDPIPASLRLCVLILLFSLTLAAQAKDYTRYVNPFIGTGGHGHTFPGATMPFGMVQLSPDTRLDNWDGSSGYHYSDDIIYGFSHTHLSGTGIPDYCDILFMPMLGNFQTDAKAGEKDVNGYASKFSHQNEKAEPGYYSVKLDDDNILAEMTATPRVGLHRYTFPKTDTATLIMDLGWRDKVLDAEIQITDSESFLYTSGKEEFIRSRIEGYRRSSSWAKDQAVYFVAEFSKTFRWAVSNEGIKVGRTEKAETFNGKSLKAALMFDTTNDKPLLVKVSLSPVSIEGARKNLAAELPGWDFDKVRADAKAAWNKELSKIEVSGGTEAQTTNFYTALYHTAIQPNIFQDADGQYRGRDRKIHIAPKDTNYTVFSLWDTFRAAHPLYTITNQKRTVDFINTFIRQYEEGGRLPVWELAGEETETMIGYHSVSVIADAMVKGITGFDYEKAYQASKHSAELDHFGLAAYKRRGYISMEDEQESVSKTLEYAYDDWCIAQMARILESRAISTNKAPYARDRAYYENRSRYFENLFDPSTGFMRPRQNGGFVKPFLPNEVSFHFTEGNSWQYTFFVPHNIPRLMELMGGREKFAAKLDELFSTEVKLAGREQPDITGMIGQYAHGNEPSHHIAYLYNYAGQAWKTRKMVRRIMDDFYKPTPDGLIGNEDCGQMSAWYVLSASGFYPVAPGQTEYETGAPIFEEIKYHLESGKTFTIRAPGASSQKSYVKSVKLNGMPLLTQLTHQDIMHGGVLEFEMTDKEVMVPALRDKIAISLDMKPVLAAAVPVIEGGSRVFTATTTVTLGSNTRGAQVYYTTDGAEPGRSSKKYRNPFTIDKTTTVKAIAISETHFDSKIAEARFFKKPNDWTVKIANKYNRQYTGGGDEGLIDGIRGTVNWASGEWQGYQPYDLDAVIDLQRETEIKRVGGGFLQDARPWIWMPTHIEFEVSGDGVNFRKVADIKTDVDPKEMTPTIRDYKQAISPVKARYVRVRAYNLGKIPSWHPGAGDDAFIFVDEIFVE